MKARNVISLFTGAGGLDLGFEAAGFQTAAAVEMNADAVATIRHNREWPVLDRDIQTVSSEEILSTAGLGNAEADLVIGGPPCQPFSKSGYWTSGDSLRLEDPRANTLSAFLRVVRDILPAAFLLENVPGLAYKGKSEGLDFIERALEGINRETGASYTPIVAQLNAADFGVPQLRQRVFVIGSRDGERFSFPPPTHQPIPPDKQKPMSELPLHKTAWDALGDLEDEDDPELEVTGKWAALLPSIPEGENYLYHTDRGDGKPLFGWRRRFWSFLLKLAKDRPSWTIQAQPGPAVGPFHWKSRRLSARELCRLQTFPDSYEVVGDLRSVQRQVGNAVPSALAEILAQAIRQQIFGDDIKLAPSLTPQVRRPIPDAEPPQDISSEYLHLVGEYSPHPGTGRGFSAAKRKVDETEQVEDNERSDDRVPDGAPLFA